jgi:uncharacterized protein (DUF169 family)
MDYKRYSESIKRMIMPQSFPLGVKIIKKDEPFPDGVVRPSKFGIKVALCQWTTLARRWGWVVGTMAEDINCAPCSAAFGFRKLKSKADFVQFIMDMGYFHSRDLASAMAEQSELLKPGEIKGIVTFPLDKAPLSPDLVVIYGTPAQMTRLAVGRGERMLAGTADNEMSFAAPASYLEALVDGLEKTQKKGLRYPMQGYLLYQPPLIPPMKALEEKLMDL